MKINLNLKLKVKEDKNELYAPQKAFVTFSQVCNKSVLPAVTADFTIAHNYEQKLRKKAK